MSVEDKESPRNSPGGRSKDKHKTPAVETLGSQYALQVALQTMKERCQQLQQRLAAEEEENLRLRMTLTSVKNLSGDENESDDEKIILRSPRREVTSSEEKIARLSRQNSQLRHHLFMVASENRQLWCRLSSLTEANQSLGNQLSKISLSLPGDNSVSKIPETGNTACMLGTLDKDKMIQNKDGDNMLSVQLGDNKIILPSFAVVKSQGSEDQSLEEMSIKLLKNLLQEKIGLEQQYAEMVKMHSETSSFAIPNLDFGYLEDCDESTLEQLSAHHAKLCELKAVLEAQRSKLRVALESVGARRTGEACCEHVEKATMTEAVADAGAATTAEARKWRDDDLACCSAELRQQLEQVAEPPGDAAEVRMCPLCRRLYDMSASTFDDFAQHVYAHFQSEEADPALDNFEVIQE
ncbi:protein spindle-F [Bacillus rossius redtenbacheri]|uniref:protein spindle-F n=1 Tax=Bacillus rossius redtenbacheri TaxID=93214 RepID=UPI002FDDA88D